MVQMLPTRVIRVRRDEDDGNTDDDDNGIGPEYDGIIDTTTEHENVAVEATTPTASTATRTTSIIDAAVVNGITVTGTTTNIIRHPDTVPTPPSSCWTSESVSLLVPSSSPSSQSSTRTRTTTSHHRRPHRRPQQQRHSPTFMICRLNEAISLQQEERSSGDNEWNTI